MHEVALSRESLGKLGELLGRERDQQLRETAAGARELLEGRRVWHVNATASGGGVAEMLQALLGYTLDAGVDSRWLVLDGGPPFFTLTKRIHNLLHGSVGDGGPLGADERGVYEASLEPDIDDLVGRLRRDDVVVLHDPQTAGMVQRVKAAGASVIWRCHVGKDEADENTDRAWSFLQPYVEQADASIFSRQEYVPDWMDPDRVRIIPPSIDPYSAKNAEMTSQDVAAVLRRGGLVEVSDHAGGSVAFLRRDGREGAVRELSGLIHGGQVVPEDARVVLQVSRWDRLKDMAGVLRGFTDRLPDLPDDAHLMLVGPDVSGVSDDPEGAEVLEECRSIWEGLSAAARPRVHLCALPMDDVDENARIVNALQRYASVVVQKSLVEGFGLTVTEPMWKSRPVLASRVGGIQDQITDGESGVLLDDPSDLQRFGALLSALLTDPGRAERLGVAARERVRENYLGDGALMRYARLIRDLSA